MRTVRQHGWRIKYWFQGFLVLCSLHPNLCSFFPANCGEKLRLSLPWLPVSGKSIAQALRSLKWNERHELLEIHHCDRLSGEDFTLLSDKIKGNELSAMLPIKFGGRVSLQHESNTPPAPVRLSLLGWRVGGHR